MQTMTKCTPQKVISSGRVTVKLFRVEVGCDVNYRFIIQCDDDPQNALTLGELRMIEDAIRESIRDAEAAACHEMNLEYLKLPKPQLG